MYELEQLIQGNYHLRSVKDREGDKDYFLDNEGRPLILKYKIEMEFFKVSSILLRVGQGNLYSVHFLMYRDLLSAMSFIELDGEKHQLSYEVTEENAKLTITLKEGLFEA